VAKKKKQKPKIGALGPQPHWLDMSVADRARTKQYIKEGLQGYVRPDGVSIPGARRIYKGMSASDGFDLSHIERWSSAKLAQARNRVQSISTLTARPFAVVIPRSERQRKAARVFTGQTLPYQKEMIVAVQNQKLDRVTFKDNKVVVERKFPSGTKTIQQRYLFREYVERGESYPVGFVGMQRVLKKMLPDMPERYHGSKAYYTILTQQYGPIGRSVFKEQLLDEFAYYHSTYGVDKQHQHFDEQVIGVQMVGTFVQARDYQNMRDRAKAERKRLKKLRFGLRARCPVRAKNGKQCTRNVGHTGKHSFGKR
jgi:hypothetical protein